MEVSPVIKVILPPAENHRRQRTQINHSSLSSLLFCLTKFPRDRQLGFWGADSKGDLVTVRFEYFDTALIALIGDIDAFTGFSSKDERIPAFNHDLFFFFSYQCFLSHTSLLIKIYILLLSSYFDH